ncbi:uncharacterized protein TERG_07751 [Trichophyton rubrum CBS 118892]|uniref:Protein kinase domain-containing protein n=1 Tax=Trichophyton rubrum (strain ATCC MYA-4607 / CBS 118892) TaxID=559305 RepID=F2SYY0_TRIRC|nr:uncharacterized protein TERG_07751 [Trichophyton rubrum CBS 118892]EGD91532.2 hypothetical protein TERG_07751 [Trichophyton rubrum CBS 118892]
MALPSSLIDGQYELQKRLGDGTYVGRRRFQLGDGPALLGEDGEMMIMLESCDAEAPSLEREIKNYYSLAGGVGVPLVESHGIQDGCRFLVRQRDGPTLEALLGWCESFSVKTVLLLADQLIGLLELIHSQSLFHLGIRPSAFALGTGKASNQITLTGAGEIAATADFLGAKPRVAPWRGLEVSLRDSKYDDIHRYMMAAPIEALCEGLPRGFAEYFRYLSDPVDDDKPNYDYLRQLFYTAFEEKRFLLNGVFDWTVYKYRKNAKQDLSQPISGITSEVGGIRFSEEEFETEFNYLVGQLHQAEEWCMSLSKRDRSDRTPVYWEDVASAHHTLIAWCLDIVSYSQHPEAPDGLICRAQDLQLQEEVWEAGIKRYLTLLEADIPHTRDIMKSFLHQAFTILTVFAQLAPQHKEKWERYIRDLSAYGMKYECSGPWGRVYKRWGGSMWRRAGWTTYLLVTLLVFFCSCSFSAGGRLQILYRCCPIVGANNQ